MARTATPCTLIPAHRAPYGDARETPVPCQRPPAAPASASTPAALTNLMWVDEVTGAVRGGTLLHAEAAGAGGGPGVMALFHDATSQPASRAGGRTFGGTVHPIRGTTRSLNTPIERTRAKSGFLATSAGFGDAVWIGPSTRDSSLNADSVS
jgi:hypothetical protein